MLETFKQLTVNQFEAALATLNACIDGCSESAWDAPVGKFAFCQVALHALFFTDLYLGVDPESVARQSFHLANKELFGDYEQFRSHEPTALNERAPTKAYLQHCRTKAVEVVPAETADTLQQRSGFEWLPVSRAEVHVYNIRHLQHHAAQLSLRLNIDADIQIPWVASGWRDA